MKVKVFKFDDRYTIDAEQTINDWFKENKVDVKNITHNVVPAYGWCNGSWLVITIFYE